MAICTLRPPKGAVSLTILLSAQDEAPSKLEQVGFSGLLPPRFGMHYVLPLCQRRERTIKDPLPSPQAARLCLVRLLPVGMPAELRVRLQQARGRPSEASSLAARLPCMSQGLA